jgi:hypothetical protein
MYYCLQVQSRNFMNKELYKPPLSVINYAIRHEDVWGSEGIASAISTLALDEGEWSASRPCRFTPGGELTVPIG